MGLLDSLFGSGKKTAAPKKAKTAERVTSAVVAAESNHIKPEIVAAICASINMIINDDAELIAAVAATIIHARRRGIPVLRIKRSSDAWSAIGRQKLMDARQSLC